jgi:uncharacterized phiE125 gp8 family phage protein
VLELTSGPSETDVLTLVSVEQMKAQKRIVTNRENDFIKECILDAWGFIDGVEGKCRRAVLPQSYRFTLTRWCGYRFTLPVHGTRAVTKISATIGGAAPVDLLPSAFRVERTADGIDASVIIMPGTVLAGMVDGRDSVVIEFSAGWPDAASVPRAFRRALRLIAAHFYDNREETFGDNRVTVVSRSIELGASKLLEKWIVPLDYAGIR